MRRIRLACVVWLLALAGVCATASARERVFIQVLGIAQDAGYPQAGCYEPHCMRAWNDRSLRRLTSSIAIVDERHKSKYIFDATPDLREQLFALERAAPDKRFRIGGVFLTHGHIGHYTGLMHFGHEAMGASEIPVYAMPRMRAFLSGNGPWDQLVRFENIVLKPLEADRAVEIERNLRVTPILVPHRDEYTETVGFRIDGPRRSALFIPDIDKWQRWDRDIVTLVRSVDYALVDATFFDGKELPGRDMSKIPHPSVKESMALLDALKDDERARVVFIHMNHTNPLLIDGSAAQQRVLERGFRFAKQGLILEL